MKKHLYRTERNKKIFGVCAGIAEEFDIDVTLIRVIWALIALCYGVGVLVYFVCAFIFPVE
ncbi:MAG: PspC domain-containing protein [Clostridia bacterium]|nr:PspC domain-containing protein [Clostridia bacterium]